MLDHLGIKIANYPAARAFYDAATAPLGAAMLMQMPPEHTGGRHVVGFGRDQPTFWLSEGEPGAGIHIAFAGPQPCRG